MRDEAAASLRLKKFVGQRIDRRRLPIRLNLTGVHILVRLRAFVSSTDLKLDQVEGVHLAAAVRSLIRGISMVERLGVFEIRLLQINVDGLAVLAHLSDLRPGRVRKAGKEVV